MTYLYIKIHKETGLKYFGKTTKNPYSYNGSGLYWKRHLKVHGTNLTTLIVGSYLKNSDLLVVHALNFSQIYNIVDSIEWANLINENGLDGNCVGTKFSRDTKNKIGRASKGRVSPKKNISYEEYYGTDKGNEIISKMLSSKYHSANSYEERFGITKAKEQREKLSIATSGSNNPNAGIWLLTAPDGTTEVITELAKRLKTLNLPYGTLKDSVFYNRTVIRGKAKDWKLEKIKEQLNESNSQH